MPELGIQLVAMNFSVQWWRLRQQNVLYVNALLKTLSITVRHVVHKNNVITRLTFQYSLMQLLDFGPGSSRHMAISGKSGQMRL